MLVYPDMHRAFRLNLDKSSSLVGNPDFLPEEIDFWLNEAQERFVKQRVFGNNLRKEALEQGQKRVDDLKTLICTYYGTSLSASSLGSNVKETLIPVSATAPYLFYLDSALHGSVTSNVLQCGQVISTKDLSKYVADSINTPYIRRPLVYFYNSVGTNANQTIAFIYSSEFVPYTVDITYIKKPKVLTYTTVSGYQTNTPDLPEETHKEIVNLAVQLVIENIESSRVQTFPSLNASNIE